MSTETISSPISNPETKAFWEAANAGRLGVGRCHTCGKAHFYPRAMCPFCGSAETALETAAGTGSVYSFSVMRRGSQPYALAYVQLKEGPCMMTRLVDCDLERIAIGSAVKVVFKASEDGTQVPFFTLSA